MTLPNDFPSNQALLAQLCRVLTHMVGLGSEGDERRTASDFMYGILDLGRAVHAGRLRRDDPELASFLADSAAQLPFFHPRLAQFISLAEGKLRSSFEEGLELPVYLEASEARSAVEFLREFYGPTAYGAYLYLLDTQDMDEDLKKKAMQVGQREPPPVGIPGGHWWWLLD